MLTGSKTDGCRSVQNIDDSSRLVSTRLDESRLEVTLQKSQKNLSKPKHGTRHTYGLLTKCEVKMAGYWPGSFFACLITD